MQPQEFIQQLQSAGQVGAVYADVRRGKALAGIVSEVTVTDTSGATVDTDEFFGAADEDDVAADATAGDENENDENKNDEN